MGTLQNGKYRLTNVATSLRLDDKGDYREIPPASAYVGPANDGPHQIWAIKSVADGVYTLCNEATHMMLDGNAKEAIYTLGGEVGNKYQQWRIVQVGDNYRLTSQATELRLESAGGHALKGGVPTEGDNQKWVITQVK